MFKSIFSKMITANILVLVICMIITGTFSFTFLSEYVIERDGHILLEESKRVNDMTQFYLSNPSSITEKLYQMNIEGISNRQDGMMFIADTKGNIVIASNKFRSTVNAYKIDKKYISEVAEKKEFTGITDFGGMFHEKCLVVGTPLEYNAEIVGITYLAVPVPEIYKTRYEIFKISVIAMTIAIAISVFIWYILSHYMVMPLKSLNQVAKQISKGNFKARVTLHGKDEIASLGETFNNMAASLENLENARASFVSNVSHELRTPMTTISGFIEGILDGTVPEEDREKYLGIVLDETKRLARLVNEFLMLARLESGENKPDMKVFDLNELIRISALGFEKQLFEKNISVDINFENEKTFVLADKDSISRVLTNILDNAVKFNFQNGYLKILVYKRNKKINVAIENSGIGINEDELTMIWDRFYKTDKSRSLDKKGVGLGLFLIHNILVAHGEKIWVDSENGKYARFTFTLEPASEEK